MKRIGVCVIVAAGILGGVSSQTTSTPLPDGMGASFGSTIVAEDMRLITDPDDYVGAEVRFRNGTVKEVEFVLVARSGDAALTNPVVYEESTSFQPTAVCAPKPLSNVLFVAGWQERTSRVVLEKWEFGSFVLGSSALPGGGGEMTTFSPPPIQRTRLLDTDTIRPIVDIVAAPFSGADGVVWMMEFDGDRRILGFDIATETVLTDPIDSGASYTPLMERWSMNGLLHETDGYVIMCAWYPAWSKPGGDADFICYVDMDLDGVFETQRLDLSWDGVATVFTNDHWVAEY